MSKKIGDKNNWVRTFEVTEPTRHKKGFTVYKVVSTVFSRSFLEGATKITVWKRYNDFKKLHKELELIFRQLYLKGEFPKFPKDKVFGRFDDRVIEERRKCALALLEFAASYSQLFTHKIFLKFFETSYDASELIRCSHNAQDVTIEGGRDNHQVACLIPERVWEERSKPEEADCDHQSLSSFTSSSPDTIPVADSESLMSGSMLSEVNEPFQNLHIHSKSSDMPHSLTPKVTTFTDSSQPLVASSSTTNSNIPLPYSLQEPRRNLGIVSSVSLTEDLDLFAEDELSSPVYYSEKRFPNSASSVSLDTLLQEPATASQREPSDTTSNCSSNSNKSKNKKLNGFGFFDFLPIFAKKQDSNIPEEKSDLSFTPSYICEAAGNFTAAHHHESNGEYECAVEAYKNGITILFEGSQDDPDKKRQMLVRKKIEKYLTQAEMLKDKIDQEIGLSSKSGPYKGFLALSSPRKKLQNLAQEESSSVEDFHVIDRNVVPSSMEELKLYKVVGCTFGNILIAVDSTVIGGPKCYAVKILRKSAAPLDVEKPTLIPSSALFVVQLIKWFNTNDAIILILQYASGGRLIDFVKTYQTKQISPVSLLPSPTSDYEDEEGCSSFGNHLAASLESSKKSIDALTECDENINCQNEVNVPVNTTNVESGVVPEMPLEGNSNSEIEKINNVEERNDTGKSESETNEKVLPTIVCDRVDLTVRNSDWTSQSNQSLKSETIDIQSECAKDGEKDCEDNSACLNSSNHHHLYTEEINHLDFEFNQIIENSKGLLRSIATTLLGEKERSPKLQRSNTSSLHKNNCSSSTNANVSSLNSSSDSTQESIPSSSFSQGSRKSEERDTLPRPKTLLDCFSQALEDNNYSVPDKMSFMNVCNQNNANSIDEECPELKRMVPECCVKIWAAEIVVALEKLHSQGITYGDLDINNILLGESGHILLSYRALWNEVDTYPTWNEFSAPEVSSSWGRSLWKAHPSADWWSFGAILFLLITGQTLQDIHPEGIHPQTVINVPLNNACGDLITPAAKTLLTELLHFLPSLRLGYYGAEEVKNHPFFDGFDWYMLRLQLVKNVILHQNNTTTNEQLF